MDRNADPPQTALPARSTANIDAGRRRSILVLTILAAVAVVIAVFGHPVQSIAAALIVIALVSLVQGRSVDRVIAVALWPMTRAPLRPVSADCQDGARGASPWPSPPTGPILRQSASTTHGTRQVVDEPATG